MDMRYVGQAAPGVAPSDEAHPGFVARVVLFSDRSCEIYARRISTRESLWNSGAGGGPGSAFGGSVESDEAEILARKAEENRERSARRTVQRCRYAVKELHCDRLLTFTTRACITDRSDFLRLLNLFVNRVRNKFGVMFPYVMALELQKRGAYHAHMAVSGYKQIRLLTEMWWAVCGGRGSGAVNVRGPRPGFSYSPWQTQRLAGYLSKYVAKDAASDGEGLHGRQRLLRSKGSSPVISLWFFPASRYASFGDFVVDLARDFGVHGSMLFRSEDCAWWCGAAGDG